MMMDDNFDVHIPWIIDEDTEFTLNIHDKRLLGSKRYFIRLDLYPSYAPSHMRRHHGFWDLPLKFVKRERSKLTLKQGELIVKNGWSSVRLKPVWKGELDFIGYGMVHVSLWDFSTEPPIQLTIKSSQHVLRRGNRDLPLEHVSLPITQRCNLKCPMCMRHIPGNWEVTDVAPEILHAVFEASPFLRHVSLSGTGEPLLYDNLPGIIGELKRRMPEESQVGFNTNGTLMTRKTASRIIDLGVNWIIFSVDGATKSAYERIRIGADFDEIIENIARTVKYRNASGQKNLSVQSNYVIQKGNVHEIPAFAELAGSLGLDSVTFSHLRDFKAGEVRVFGEDILAPLFDEAAEIGRKYGMKITFPLLHPLEEPRCVFMQAAFLWLDGDVVPCCRMLKGAYPDKIKNFGNLQKEALLDIWNSAEYREFRHRVLTQDLPHECRRCNYAAGLC